MKTKKLILCLMLATFGLNESIAQVGIGTNSPSINTILDMQSNTQALDNKGIGLPRVDLSNFTDQSNTTIAPKDGLMVYNLGNNGLAEGVYTWYNTQWNLNANETQGAVTPRFLVKLNSDFQLFTQDAANPVSTLGAPQKIVGFNVIYDMLNFYNPTADTFSVTETGLYNIEINFDYTITGNTIDLPFPNSPRPNILYGIYNETDANWVYRRYEYVMTDRLTAVTAGASVRAGGYTEMIPGKVYSFRMLADVMQANATVTIKATNSGSTGSSDSTFLNVNKMSGI